MKPVLIAIAALSLVPLSSCTSAVEPDLGTSLTDMTAIERFAVDAVYEAFPTRAFVQSVETTASEGQYLIHVQMSGAPEFRKIYDVTVAEADDGDLSLVSLETVQ